MKLLKNSRLIKAIIRLCFMKLVYREIYYSERDRERIVVSYDTISLIIKVYFCLETISRSRVRFFYVT